MTTIDPAQLSEMLHDVDQDFWVHIETSTPLDKYPAKQHARRVAGLLDVNKGLIYLAGTPTAYLEDSDQFVPFRQRRYFYYLSGVDEPDCHLTYDIEKDLLRLYVPEVNPQKTIWFGRGSTIDEALDKYDVDTASWSTALKSDIETWISKRKGDIFILHQDQGLTLWRYPSPRVNHKRLQAAIDIARVRKDAHEIKLIKKANDISAKAHTNVLANIHRYTNETEVEATFLDNCITEGAKNQAYSIIAASGVNAATLHYVKNDEPLKGRQLMCLDAGAEWQCYASDVTRTFPLTGSWPSVEAEEIYGIVEEMQETVISMLAPGVRYLDMHYLAHRIAITGLLKLGILHNGTRDQIFRDGTSRAFFPHGLGHHVGLEVHDVSGVPLMANASNSLHAVCDPDLCKSPVDLSSNALEEGMIVTVEPGIYFSSVALAQYLKSPIHSKYINKEVLEQYLPVGGVRIEDDILITESGYENLTTAPKGEAMLQIIKSGCKSSEGFPKFVPDNEVKRPLGSSAKQVGLDSSITESNKRSIADHDKTGSEEQAAHLNPPRLFASRGPPPLCTYSQDTGSHQQKVPTAFSRFVAKPHESKLSYPDDYPELPAPDPFPTTSQPGSTRPSSLFNGFQQLLPPVPPVVPDLSSTLSIAPRVPPQVPSKPLVYRHTLWAVNKEPLNRSQQRSMNFPRPHPYLPTPKVETAEEQKATARVLSASTIPRNTSQLLAGCDEPASVSLAYGGAAPPDRYTEPEAHRGWDR